MEKSLKAVSATRASRDIAVQCPAGQWIAMNAVTQRGVSIALACRAFEISETCYRYSPVLDLLHFSGERLAHFLGLLSELNGALEVER